jgi:hypothetical protein
MGDAATPPPTPERRRGPAGVTSFVETGFSHVHAVVAELAGGPGQVGAAVLGASLVVEVQVAQVLVPGGDDAAFGGGFVLQPAAVGGSQSCDVELLVGSTFPRGLRQKTAGEQSCRVACL